MYPLNTPKKGSHRHQYRLLSEHFEMLKELMVKKKMTFKEISLNTGIPEGILVILFSEKHNLVDELSTLFEFFSIKISARRVVFKPYKVYDDGVQIRVSRVIEPRAFIHYDRRTQSFYNFQFRRRRFKETEEMNRNTIMVEMQEYVKKIIEKKDSKKQQYITNILYFSYILIT